MSNQTKTLVKAKPEAGIWMEQVPIPDEIAAIFDPFCNFQSCELLASSAQIVVISEP